MTISFGRRKSSTPEAGIAAAPAVPAATGQKPDTTPAMAGPRNSGTDIIRDLVLSRVEPSTAASMGKSDLTLHVDDLVGQIANERRLVLNKLEQKILAAEIVDDMLGLGPIESLLRDQTVSDILINGPTQTYIERLGHLEPTAVQFRNDAHIMHVAQRIATMVGRRIDESSPMLDARLPDGSRVNVIIPPLSLKGPCISIRKFSKKFANFDTLIQSGSMPENVAHVLQIAARCRLNIIISGGTGSGKTTLLNAMSRMIDVGERIVTIEDTAELQLQQPHVLQLETRQPNIEGHGQVTQRDLVRNALRMRPDRIIVGEVRGSEAFDMLQAMNTGHNGSMSTVHANTPRDALTRIENMVLMADLNLPLAAIRAQIPSALDMVVHIDRMRDGTRRVTDIMEVVGLEEEIITTASIFRFRYIGENTDGTLHGIYDSTGIRPHFMPRIAYYGLADAFMEAIDTAKVPP